MPNKIDLSGRNAVITGGAQGIGRAIVERFLDSGAGVAIWDRDKAFAAKTASELSNRGKVIAVACDVTDIKDVERARDDTCALGRIDILVNNAGIAGQNAATWDYPVDEWNKVMRVNLDGPFHCCRSLAPLMIAQGYGRIVNIASIAGKEGNPNACAYSVSKAGVIALTKSLGKELAAYDIAVNCITPAAAKTAIFDQMKQEHIDYMLSKIPRARFVKVEEIAALAAWCASADNSFTTGAVFDISGGRATYSSPAEQAHRDRLTGIALMCGAVFLFAGNDAAAKFLNGHMHTVEVVWARYMSAFLLAVLLLNPVKNPQVMRTGRPWLQLGRSALLLLSTVLNFFALRYLQLDQAVAIIFCTPFIVAALGGPMLGEWIGLRRWAAIMVGFCGVLLVTRPGFGGIHPAALLVGGAAICYAIYSIMTRILARTDRDTTTNFYSNLVGAVAISLAVPFFWTPQSDPKVILLMGSMGFFSGFGHYLLIRAHRLSPAAVLAPFIYTEIVWMIALGFFVFGDVPTSWTLAGVAIVIGSGLYLLYRERVMGPRRSPLD